MSGSSASAVPFAQAVALADSRPGERILDLSGRAGLIALQVAGAAASVEVVQPETELVEEGRRLARVLGAENVYFHACARSRLPFDPGQFDLVFWCLALSGETYPVATTNEIARVLAPDGRLILQEVVSLGEPALDLKLWEMERWRNAGHLIYYSEAEIQALLALAGLRPVRIERSALTQDFDYWAESVEAQAPDPSSFRAVFLGLPPEDQARLDLSLADQRISFAYPVATIVASPL